MKYLIPLFSVAAFAFLFPACEKKPETAGEKVKEAVDDALDRRPAEGVKDAAEDAKDAVKDAAEEVKDAAKEATE